MSSPATTPCAPPTPITPRVAAQLCTGATFVNAHNAPWLDERAPFGGFNQSGMGCEMREEGILAFTDTHSVSYPAELCRSAEHEGRPPT